MAKYGVNGRGGVAGGRGFGDRGTSFAGGHIKRFANGPSRATRARWPDYYYYYYYYYY